MRCSSEEKWRLKCERLENEVWGDVRNFKEELRKVLANSDNITKEQQSLISAAAGVALMHIYVMDAEDGYYGFEENEDDDLVEVESNN